MSVSVGVGGSDEATVEEETKSAFAQKTTDGRIGDQS